MEMMKVLKAASGLFAVVAGITWAFLGVALADVPGNEEEAEARPRPAISPPEPLKSTEAPAELALRKERWKKFREHLEAQGRKDLLPEEGPDEKPPTADAVIGILFKMSPDLAAAHELLEREPPELAAARARLKKLEGTKDPYLADYAALLGARSDLASKDFPAARCGFETVLGSSRNLAAAEARRGLAECYRGMGETTLEVLELRFLIAELPPDRTADQSWAEERLAEIRRDHPGPLNDSARRMRDLSTRLLAAGPAIGGAEGLRGDQEKVEDILLKVAKILEEAAKKCPNCSSSACKPCRKCGACTASGMCAGGNHSGSGGNPIGNQRGGPADRSTVAQEEPGEKKLRESSAKDADAWGSINEREVAKALQDLWGKIPPSYRQTVAQYFRDIAGLEPPPASPPPAGER